MHGGEVRKGRTVSDETSPGPWRWDESGMSGELLDASGKKVIYIDRSHAWDPGDETLEVSPADARLIAAAPETAERLKLAVAMLGEAMGWLEDPSDYAQKGGRDFDARVRALLKRIDEGTK